MARTQIESPKILVCPSDKNTTSIADHFGTGAGGFSQGNMQANALSYFVGTDALNDNERVMCLLVGDRNIGLGLNPLTQENCSFGAQAHTLPRGNNTIGFTNSVHSQVGNIALVEGSVQSVTSAGLRDLLADPAFADENGNNHILMPK